MSPPTPDAVAILAQALTIDASTIGPDTTLMLCPQWDSLAHMRIILALESSIGQTLTPDAILSIEGLDDVATILASHASRSDSAAETRPPDTQ